MLIYNCGENYACNEIKASYLHWVLMYVVKMCSLPNPL